MPMEIGNRVKTDRRDSLKLARVLAARMLKEVFVLTEEQRAHRDLVRTRGQLVRHRIATMAQIVAFMTAMCALTLEVYYRYQRLK